MNYRPLYLIFVGLMWTEALFTINGDKKLTDSNMNSSRRSRRETTGEVGGVRALIMSKYLELSEGEMQMGQGFRVGDPGNSIVYERDEGEEGDIMVLALVLNRRFSPDLLKADNILRNAVYSKIYEQPNNVHRICCFPIMKPSGNVESYCTYYRSSSELKVHAKIPKTALFQFQMKE